MTPIQLLQRRRALGLTQAELAEHLGLTPRTIQRYERGDTPIPTPIALLLENPKSKIQNPKSRSPKC